jgi:phosphohistidine phosphatase SixA
MGEKITAEGTTYFKNLSCLLRLNKNSGNNYGASVVTVLATGHTPGIGKLIPLLSPR